MRTGAGGGLTAGADMAYDSLPMNATERMWRGWEPGRFQIHFIHTGVAEALFLVFPDATSLGMVFSYGAFRFGAFGDFSDRFTGPDGRETSIEDELAAAIGRVSVAKLNHHGHHTTSRALAAALRPRVWVAPVWDQLHCTDDSMELLPEPGAPDDRQPVLVPTFLPNHPAPAPAWHRLVPAPCRDGCHAVVTVPPGGEPFSLELLDARDEAMRVAWSRTFPAR